MKEARENDNADKVSEHMTKSLELNQKFMMLNFKPMVVTMLFVGLFFPWMGSTFSPNVPIQQSGEVYTGELEYASSNVPLEVQNSSENSTVLMVEGQEIEQGETFEALDVTWEYRGVKEGGWLGPDGQTVAVAAEFVQLPFGLWYIGSALNWLGFYILIAMPLTFAFRKMLGIA